MIFLVDAIFTKSTSQVFSIWIITIPFIIFSSSCLCLTTNRQIPCPINELFTPPPFHHLLHRTRVSSFSTSSGVSIPPPAPPAPFVPHHHLHHKQQQLLLYGRLQLDHLHHLFHPLVLQSIFLHLLPF